MDSLKPILEQKFWILVAAAALLVGAGWWVGWAGCLGLLAWQHWVVRPGDLSRLNAAFFSANAALSAWLFAAAAVDILRA